jgi:beta-lactamase class A
MMKHILFCLAVCSSLTLHGQRKKNELQNSLNSLVQNFHGRAGLYVRHLKTGETFGISADTLFPTASMIKIPIAVSLFDQIEKGNLDYHAEFVYKDSLHYDGGGEDMVGSFCDGEKISLQKLVMAMLNLSDNTASLWCQHLAGSGTAINGLLEKQGFEKTRINSRTPGRESFRNIYGWGQTTPREMAELLTKINEAKIISAGASERLIRTLNNNYWDAVALSEIPPYVQVASKNGALDQSRSEVVLVNAPHGDYVFCVITKDQKDQSWTPDNEAWMMIKKISALLWEYFEPKDKWKPAQGISKWY